jgi:tRNA (cmo5U34)-methyltransferase
MKSSLEIPKAWTFRSHAVAKHFDQHVREQLPWYDLATNAVAHFGRHYIPNGGRVYDIGASTGNIGLALKETLDQRQARFTAIEESQEMAERYQGPPELVVADAVGFDFEAVRLRGVLPGPDVPAGRHAERSCAGCRPSPSPAAPW